MGTEPERFVRETELIEAVWECPPDWVSGVGDHPAVSVFAAQTADQEEPVQLLTLSSGATATQRARFDAGIAAWTAYSDTPGIVSVVDSERTPRPWIAVESPAESRRPTSEAVDPEDVRPVLIHLAESFWVVEQSGWDGPPTREQIRIDEAGTPRIEWPVWEKNGEMQPVEMLGELGAKLWQRAKAPAECETDRRVLRALDRATSPKTEHRSCYEFKRDLLFGAAPDHGTSDLSSRQPAHAMSEAGQKRQSADEVGSERSNTQLPDTDRRTVLTALGVGGLGVSGVVLAGSGDESERDRDDEIPDAAFEFEREGETLIVTHAGGDRIDASQLVVENPGFSSIDEFEWTAYSGFEPGEPVSPGDSLELDLGTQILMGVQVVWRSADADTEITLATQGEMSGSH